MWWMSRSCNKQFTLIIFPAVWRFGLVSSTLTTSCTASLGAAKCEADFASVWKNVFPHLLHKKYNINLETHLAVNHRHIYEACQLVKGNPTVDTSGGKERLVSMGEGHFSAGQSSSGSLVHKGQKNNICKMVRVTGGVQNQSCLFYGFS